MPVLLIYMSINLKVLKFINVIKTCLWFHNYFLVSRKSVSILKVFKSETLQRG